MERMDRFGFKIEQIAYDRLNHTWGAAVILTPFEDQSNQCMMNFMFITVAFPAYSLGAN
jgi:hypothetical protein